MLLMSMVVLDFFIFFFFNDTATTEIYTLSLHDALPISDGGPDRLVPVDDSLCYSATGFHQVHDYAVELQRALQRSEEHTSELQSPCNLVCRLLLEKKNRKMRNSPNVLEMEATDASTSII